MSEITHVPLTIQPDYWTGSQCLELGSPWLVPEASRLLDQILRPEDAVLELGTGGSTLFYARRCARVIAIETDYGWYTRVLARLRAERITNVAYVYCPLQEAIEILVQALSHSRFDVISVDTVHGFNRSRFLRECLRVEGWEILVLDNYSSAQLFPEGPWTPGLELQATVHTFDDPHWHGSGTRVVRR